MRVVILLLLNSLLAIAAPADDAIIRPRFSTPVRAWFQPQFLDTRPSLYPAINFITSLDDAEVAETLAKKGVTVLKWAYGPQSEHSQGKVAYYRDQCEPQLKGKKFRFHGVGIDEWNPGDGRFKLEAKLAAEGYRQARKKWPDNLVVAFVTTPDQAFLDLIRERTIDLAIIEGYGFIPDVGGLTTEGIKNRCEVFKKANLLDRCIVCFGYVSAAKDKSGRRMTSETLRHQVQEVLKAYPQMPGIAFYGYRDESAETPQLILTAEKLALELYPAKK
ncbi:MAG: hypothetical protein ACKO23_20665 [Gemmataceae bacterium]